MPNISLYRSAKDNQGMQVDLEKTLQAIKKGAYKAQIEAIRGAEPAEQDALKRELPAVTFAGTFSTRKTTGLLEATGLLTLDFDVEGIELPADLLPFCYAHFRSPRGGLKALIKIPVVKEDAEFKEYFRALQAIHDDIDPSGKDISRLCFMSYDPGLYLNPDCKTWTKRLTITTKAERPGAQRAGESTANWSKVALILKIIKTATIGNRHDNFLKAGNLAGGYYATGELSDSEIELFKREIEASTDEPTDHLRAFADGVQYGKGLPLESKRGEDDVYKNRKSIKAEYEASPKVGDIFYTAADKAIEEAVWKTWREGVQKGVSTGWDKLDALYSVMLGYTTFIYGSPYQGKSIFTMNLLINLSRLHGWNHCLFTPEMGTPAEVIRQLVEIYVKKDIGDTYGNRMSEAELKDALAFVNKHFLILDAEESGSELDIEGLCLYVDLMEHKFGKKFHTLTVDPLIELKLMDATERDDLFWNGELKKGRVLAKQANRHLFFIHHTRDMGRPDGRDERGSPIYRQPGPEDLAFGQTFYRKAFMMLNVWHHYSEGAAQGDTIELKAIKKIVRAGYTYIKVVKAKPEGAGRRGEAELKYVPREHAFYDEGMLKPGEVSPAVRNTAESQQQQLDYNPQPEWLNS